MANVTLKAPTASTPGSVVFFRDGSSAVIDGSSQVSCPQELVSDLINLGFTGDYADAGEGVTGGDAHDHSGGDGAQLNHGGLSGLADDDHTQYVKHSLATAAWDFLISIGSGSPTAYKWAKKTLAEVKAALGIVASVPEPTATSDFLVAQGSPLTWQKMSIDDVKTLLGIST